ncbi:4-(cytidine 5'-diphospho)-2-C-methyl-D-erythritol kinase [Gemmatimonas sp.]|jgi:4-diphosphocytidyl-2-C-methyl-D-erythritol kinase|uniref:4-(cytidine 5'-diphospho)-2-C-methyl-D-erythritol kinase n=1 Tax=Gemmatimonas sp. TaxID=1962908 RepID=UPI0022C35BA0|nr:4-(cytidine 5'-diphospho)-2-C-methyl-D-erythritol kinase [Gemmatimonas sp.]MCZ8204722.1 4-(cytidine 5'-diphospho)-2-C-methyl-D-erythritol kinase [Gemmatimonas sp.]
MHLNSFPDSVSAFSSGPLRVERAHAKVNLLLRILAREAGGYHGLETLFQRLDLYDRVSVTVNDNPCVLQCDGPSMPPQGLGPPEQNLAWRAASAYCDAARWETGWQIAIDKHIPVGGGLGGGSADAAAVLRGLEALCPTPLGPARLLEIAGTLGADVPFMVCDIPLAWGWGRGDRLVPLPPLPPMAVTLVTFNEGVNTGAAYGAFARAREASGESVRAYAYPPDAFTSWHRVASLAANDFEQVVPALHAGVAAVLPVLRDEAARLRADGHVAMALMSGSGATCFVLHPPELRVAPEAPAGGTVVRTGTV